MSRSTAQPAHLGTLAMLALALAFPFALMVFNPTLMFERGWEQYAGTAIYLWAVLTLARELVRIGREERAFAAAPTLLEGPDAVADEDRRILPARLRQLSRRANSSAAAPMAELMELNREGSALDQEQAAGRFALTRYILYLLPVIGFIGTVEGISKALLNISKVLPLVKDLDGFLANLTGVTSALQVAFDSTLLALFLGAALMLAQTLVFRRAEDLLARVDRWVVAHALPRLATAETPVAALGRHLDALRRELAEHAGALHEFGPHVGRFAGTVDRLQQGAEAIARAGEDLGALGAEGESLREAVAALGRIEAALLLAAGPDKQLDQIRRAVDRSGAATEALSDQWTLAFERSGRAAQEQLARTLVSLKDALDLLHVSMEQGNALYRTIVKKLFDDRVAEQGITRAA